MKPTRKAQDEATPTIHTSFPNEDPELHNNLKGLFLPGRSSIPEHCSSNDAGNGNPTQWSNKEQRARFPEKNGEHRCHISPGDLWLFCQTE